MEAEADRNTFKILHIKAHKVTIDILVQTVLYKGAGSTECQ